MKKLIIILSICALVSAAIAEGMASALARGCTPVLLPPGQSLDGLLVQSGAITNINLTIGYSNNMLYFNIPLATCTGIVFNVGGTNILLKQNN
jgi:hypothetical protein